MIQCPFCHFDNEDGALFCEQCKSDLAGAPPAAAAPVAEAVAAPVAEAPPVAVAAVAEAAPAVAEAAPAEAGPPALPPGAQPKLKVARGLKIGLEYPLYEGHNFIGRADEKPVDIDLEDQESPEKQWVSRQHAVITFENGQLIIEDLNSSNGTYLNRNRIHPSERKPLSPNDIIQIGTVQLKVLV